MIKQTLATKERQKIHTRSVREYDWVKGVKIAGMPSSATGDSIHTFDWAVDFPDTANRWVLLSKSIPVLRKGYYVINNIFHFGEKQKLLVRRHNVWEWRTAKDLKYGDVLFSSDTHQTIKTVEYKKELCTVYHLEVEGFDTVYINSFAVYAGANHAN